MSQGKGSGDVPTVKDRRKAEALARLFELAARSLHSASFAEDLFPAQWTTLRYMASAPESKRTAADLARFQQIAVGPVTRTIRTLIAKGLLEKIGQGPHHRSELLALTPAGQAILDKDPLHGIKALFLTLDPNEQEIVGETLGRLIGTLQGEVTTTDGLKLTLRTF